MFENNKKINCIIRADGNSRIGHGHLKRCMALSELLKDYCNIIFCSRDIPNYMRNDLKKNKLKSLKIPRLNKKKECQYILKKLKIFDIIIIDGYNFNYNYQSFFFKKNIKVISIDDLINRKFCSNIIINHAPLVSKSKYKNVNKTKLCLGLEYKMVQKCFYTNKLLDRSKVENNVFVCLGSGNLSKLLEIKLIGILLELDDVRKIFLVSSQKDIFMKKFKLFKSLGKLKIYRNISSQRISELMQRSRFGICSSSTVAIEGYTSNLPLIIGYSADNQINIYKGLTKNKLALGVGAFKDLEKDKLKSRIKTLERYNYLKDFLYNHRKAYKLSSRKKLIDTILA
tara:strand:- start:4459 stop:5481 length:1023 start_codon:yes stop_codon:yes gene_type:complete